MKYFSIILLVLSLSYTTSAQISLCNGSLYLDGVNDYGSIQNSFFDDPGQRDFTIEFFVKKEDNTAQFPGIWGNYGQLSYNAIIITGGTRFLYLNNGQYFSTDSANNTQGIWTHYAITGNATNSTISIFVNGIKVSDRPHGTPDWDFIENSSRIGAILDFIGFQETFYFHGYIDNFRVSDIVRYTTNFTPNQFFTVDQNTRVLYTFDNLSNSVVEDLSSNNNDLTLHNGATLSTDVPMPGGPPLILQQPTNQYPDFNATISFHISNTAGSTCAWQVQSGNGFVPMSDNNEFTGTTTNTLTVKNAKSSYNSLWFRCIVTKGLCADTSILVRMFVCGKITTSPTSVDAIYQDTVQFSLTHTDLAAQYQWQYSSGSQFTSLQDNERYKGTTSSQLTVIKGSIGKGVHNYRCIVTSGVCTDTSQIASMFICGAIIAHPYNVNTSPGSAAQFSVQHSDSKADYKWIVNKGSGFIPLAESSTIHGIATSALLIDTVYQFMNAWKFACITTSGICTDTSFTALLSVCGSIISQPQSNTIIANGTTCRISIQHSDPNAEYQWQAQRSSSWDNLHNDTIVMGALASTLFLQKIPTTWNGVSVRCIVKSVICTDTSDAATLKVCGSLTSHPVNCSIKEGGTLVFAVQHTDEFAQYTWQIDTGNGFYTLQNSQAITGANQTSLTIRNAQLPYHNAEFRCIIQSGGCIDTSLTVRAQVCGSIKAEPKSITVQSGDDALFTVRHSVIEAQYQWQKQLSGSFENVMDNQHYQGVHSDSLIVLSSTQEDSSTLFRCIITAHACMDTSQIARLTVVTPVNCVQGYDERVAFYPNPVQSLLHCSLPTTISNVSIRILDRIGRVITTTTVTDNSAIDVTLLPSGVYTVVFLHSEYPALSFVKY